MRRFGNAALLVASLALSLVLMEFGLKALDLGAPYLSGPGRLHDDELLYRLPPHYADGIDAQGFRNARVADSYDIVVLGDSHAYGYNAGNDETWPARLAQATGLAVYNYGMGGYGLAQYRLLAERALDRFRPRLLVVTLFLGNDLADTCYIGERLAYWHDLYRDRGFDAWGCGDRFDPDWRAERAATGTAASVSSWLRSTRLGAVLIQHVWTPLRDRWRFRTGAGDGERLYLDTPDIRTVVGSHYAHGDADSAAGLRIAKVLLGEIADMAAQRGARLALLLVPGKPSVLLDYVDGLGLAVPDAVRSDVAAERAYEAALIALAHDRGLPWADARPALTQAIAAPGGPLYPTDADDHPNPRGYAVYTDAFLDGVERFGGVALLVRQTAAR